MDNIIQQKLNDIEQKLNLIIEEIELQKKHRREMEDLKADLLLVGKDLYDSAVNELKEVQDHLQTGDILYLVKKLLRNVNNITKSFEMLESTKDFLKDFAPISKEMALDLINYLDEIERKGYFNYIKELKRALDNIVSTFSADDVRHLADNITTILGVVKNLTQPQIMHTMNSIISIYEKFDVEVPEKISLSTIIKELNSQEMRRSLILLIKVLKSISKVNSLK